MDHSVVANEYKKESFIGYSFLWRGNKYIVEEAPFKIILRQEKGGIYCSVDVDAYYDCGVVIGDRLFWGVRTGRITGYDLAEKRICFSSYLTDETELFYRSHAAFLTEPDRRKAAGDYYLPDINLSNRIVAKVAVSVLTAYKGYLIAGDISGNVAVFDTSTLQRVMSFSVPGAVCGIKTEGSKTVIDYAVSEGFSSPACLSGCKEALRINKYLGL